MTDELVFKELAFKICDCGKYFYKNKWVKFEELDQAIEKLVRNSANINLDEVKVHLGSFEIKPGIKKEITVEIHLKENIFDLPCKIEVAGCPGCSKEGTQYFEGILQLRGKNYEVLSKVQAYVMEDGLKAKAKGVHITNVKDEKNGLDIYYSSQKYVQIIGKKLQKQFGGIFKVNPTLHTRDKQGSRDLYRVTVVLHLPSFILRDVIKVDDRIIKVTGIGKKITGINLKTGKKEIIEHNGYEAMPKHKTTVSKKEPTLEVLHPETYQSVPIANPRNNLVLDQEVEVVVDKEVFIV
ncbi:MAG: NMD3-related protein [archaeon]